MMPKARRRSEPARGKRRAYLTLRFAHFDLPPIQDALVIGRRTSIGANGIARAFQEMTPGLFRLIPVDHPTIEAVLVRESDLRKVPEDIFISEIIRHAESIMDETDTLHVRVNIEILVEGEEIQLP